MAGCQHLAVLPGLIATNLRPATSGLPADPGEGGAG
jgi:hypothetical protein